MKELDIRISHLSKAYNRPVLTDVDLYITNESYITIVGRSGSGKTTLLNILGLLEDYDSGEYRFNGSLIRSGRDYSKIRSESIGFIFQSYNLIPTLTCRENIFLPTLYCGRKNDRNDFDGLVHNLGLGPLLDQRVTTLSGGEKQRVAIARALILDPCLILADEPTGNLDEKNKNMIFMLLQNEHKKGRGIILITHDHDTAEQAETVYSLTNGVLVKQ